MDLRIGVSYVKFSKTVYPSMLDDMQKRVYSSI